MDFFVCSLESHFAPSTWSLEYSTCYPVLQYNWLLEDGRLEYREQPVLHDSTWNIASHRNPDIRVIVAYVAYVA